MRGLAFLNGLRGRLSALAPTSHEPPLAHVRYSDRGDFAGGFLLGSSSAATQQVKNDQPTLKSLEMAKM